MSTATTPLAVDAGKLRNATDLLDRRLRTAPNSVAYIRRTSHGLENVTTTAFTQDVRQLAAGSSPKGLMSATGW